MARRWLSDWRKLRCTFRLYHKWGEPIIDQGRIIHVCQRCGKQTERFIPPS